MLDDVIYITQSDHLLVLTLISLSLVTTVSSIFLYIFIMYSQFLISIILVITTRFLTNLFVLGHSIIPELIINSMAIN